MQKTGRLLAHRLGQLFIELDYESWICIGQNKGVDLKVYDSKGSMFLVAEILNWSVKTNLTETRKNKIIKNLLGYNCDRVLIYTTMGNEYYLDDLEQMGISTLKLGYQILPKVFYRHFEYRKQVIDRRIDSRETTLHIKSKLIEYLFPPRLEALTNLIDKATFGHRFRK